MPVIAIPADDVLGARRVGREFDLGAQLLHLLPPIGVPLTAFRFPLEQGDHLAVHRPPGLLGPAHEVGVQRRRHVPDIERGHAADASTMQASIPGLDETADQAGDGFMPQLIVRRRRERLRDERAQLRGEGGDRRRPELGDPL